MKELDINDFLTQKNSDTIVIFGSGPSIKNLTENDYNILNSFDTMSFNMFCKTKIKVKFYIVGEILEHYWRVKYHPKPRDNYLDKLDMTGENDISYVKLLNNESYNDTTFIIWDTPIMNNHFEFLNFNLKNNYIKLKKPVGSISPVVNGFTNKSLYNSTFLKNNKILLHQRRGLDSCIYLAKCMGYKKVIFCGVDLNDYTYAFDRDDFRKHVIKENINSPHRSREDVFEFINYLKQDIIFEVYNSDSALTKIINTVNKEY
jgi:hypothetical protein